MSADRSVVLLCRDDPVSRILYASLRNEVTIKCVIVESPPSVASVIRRRIRILGLKTVVGQLFFLVVVRLLRLLSSRRVMQIISENNLADVGFSDSVVECVDSVNSEKTVCLLKKYNPDAVIVNGTRIICRDILSSVDVPFINGHMGITPRYRGVHGGYWALVNDDVFNCGVSLHLVDEGVDTGGVIYQDRISITNQDNFVTYPFLQIAKLIPLFKKAIRDIFSGDLVVVNGTPDSSLWYHPTLIQYLRYRILKKVK